MKSESLKSPFHVSQLSPTWKNCLRLVILRFVSFTCHRCSFWSWWRRNCASVLTCKRRAMLFCVLPALNFLTLWFCQTGHLSVLHQHRGSLYLGYSPKAEHCRWTAFISSKVVMAFSISTAWCCMQNTEVQDAAPAGQPSQEAQHTQQSHSTAILKMLGEWRTVRRKNLALVSNGFHKKG